MNNAKMPSDPDSRSRTGAGVLRWVTLLGYTGKEVFKLLVTRAKGREVFKLLV
jgi:hypothetical protein